ncbi:P-loop containing nucleoside triphosphate hydrolases superfamily isoform 1 [Chlorella sorokiniana]|uniref:P-loop containing nucleoside triphosphate hydrolases superfamily isoform 1 n=1 Tax=Chlorella sorokiniana TaxID=3076 RepID=A0A2P6TTD8_CHLSO|nr:P-loop containing nucleoside triphosphate hydrolases superfamily isoform 1 [Chlorella sorokiniana]|eukprot:PRW57326.1 P-loop containing nucleoside triphosphate hydrolases superfamily isoform 1 [Chlorella sorokiniana]
MDAEGLIRQKDAELEQRGALLLKTKAAIEQLQEELAGARHEADKWRKAAERQGGELADAQSHVQALEAELEGKAREGAALLADTLALKRKLQEATDGLHSAADNHSTQASALSRQVQEAERRAEQAVAEARTAREAGTALQAAVAARDQQLVEQAAVLRQAEQRRDALEVAAKALREQLAAEQRARQEAAAVAESQQARATGSTQQLEGRLAAEAEARQRAEAAAAAAREALADEQKRRALDEAAWERRLREVQEDAAERLKVREAAATAAQDKAVREAAAALEGTKRQLTKRLYLAEGEWARKLQQSAADWAARLDAQGAEWAQRCEADKAAWAAERARLLEEAEARLTEAHRSAAAAVEEAQQRFRLKLAEAESKAAAAVQATERAWQQRLEAAGTKAAAERQAGADSLAAAAAQREQQLLAQLAAAQQEAAAKLAEAEKEWTLKLAAAQERALKEQHELERQWVERLHAAQRAAVEEQAGLRAQLEARLAAVSERVGALAQREAKQEKKRAELLRQVAALEASGEGERDRRREVEAALQEASSIFKRELSDKNQQLELLRQEIRYLRSWAGDASAAAQLPVAALEGVPCLSAAATVVPMSPARCGSPCASSLCGSPSFGAAHHHVYCFSAPTSPAASDPTAAAAAAARAVEAEVRALRSARHAFQRAAVSQHEQATSMARGINEALKRDAVASATCAAPPLRPQSAGSGGIPAGGRRKWKRDLAAELRAICGRAAVAPSAAATAAEASQRQLLELAAQRLLAGDARMATPSSNYDYVKVKIRLGSQLEHYYILSRFLLSRVLTVITLPQHKAVRIALDVKKHLVDQGRLDITQEELEEVLFDILRKKGYGDEYVQRYQMVTRFFQQKRPLIVLIAGSACTGKSTLAQQLASRLNMPNVLQTDVLYELLRASGAGDLPAEPLWRRALPPGSSLLGEFQRECATIRRALDGDLCKCIRDGKSIIIEGLHLDPGLFLREFGDPRGDPVMVPASSLDLALPGLSPAASAEAVPGMAADVAPADTAVASALDVASAATAAGRADAGSPAAAVAAQLDRLQLAPGPASAQAAAESQQLQQQATQQHQAASSGVRRSASFGDAVPSLSYSGWRRQQSPWKEAASSKALLRPRSARVGDPGLDRGQAVFMLRSVSSSGSEGGGEGGEAADLVQPVPSPRLAACISLPTVLEDGPGPLALPPGWHAEEEDDVPSTHLPPLAEEEAPSSGRSSSMDQQPAAAIEAAAGASDPAAAAPGITAWQRDPAAASLPAAQPGSVAAADAAAAAAAGTGPVFVPICLTVPDEEYDLMLQDWLARQQAAGEAAEAVPLHESALRLRQLQEHLRQYGASGVPVVETSLTDMGQALDRLHAYVLQCIALALGEVPTP